MERSPRIEKMLAPYGFEIARHFFDTFDIYHFVDKFANVQKGSCLRLRLDDREFGFDDPNTLAFQIVKDNPYHSTNCYVVTFRNSEDEIINKFERFIKLKAFL